MAEERDEGEIEVVIEPQGVELDADAVDDAEEAMREALAAVEGEAPAATGDAVPAADDRIAALEGEVRELREKWLRALADLDNYRKRVQREREEERRYRGIEVLRELLGVVDNLERALASEGSAADLKQGVEMIRRQVAGLLRDRGVERIEALGTPFDPGLHEAVSRHCEATVSEPTVSEELVPGYRMGDRLLRPAAVRVAMPPTGGDDGPESR